MEVTSGTKMEDYFIIGKDGESFKLLLNVKGVEVSLSLEKENIKCLIRTLIDIISE